MLLAGGKMKTVGQTCSAQSGGRAEMARVGNSDADGVQPEKAKRPRGKRGGARGKPKRDTDERGRRVEGREGTETVESW